MITSSGLKKLWKDAGTGRAYKEKLNEQLGIHEDPVTGMKSIKDPQCDPSEFSIRELTEGFLGHQYLEEAHKGPPSSDTMRALQQAFVNRHLFEDGPIGQSASSFIDISGFNATMGGLVERRLLEGYNLPAFIWKELFTIEPTRVNGGKIIGIPYIGDYAQQITQGVEFPSVGLNQLYVWAQPNVTYGLSCALSREAQVYDLTGELFAAAGSTGRALGYRAEVLALQCFAGITASHIMMGNISDSPNPTYQSTAGTGYYTYVNQNTTNTLTDYTSIQKAQQMFNLMRDPVNKLPMDADISVIIVDPSVKWSAKNIQRETWVRGQTNPNASGFPQTVFEAPNPLESFEMKYSNILHKVLVDSGISEANAEAGWYAGQPKKSFIYRSAWDLRTDQANPSSDSMLRRNVVAEWISQWSGQWCVREPRYMTLNGR